MNSLEPFFYTALICSVVFCAVVFKYYVYDPYITMQNANEIVTKKNRGRAILEDVDGVFEVVGARILGDKKALLTLRGNDGIYRKKFDARDIMPKNSFQALVSNERPVWQTVRNGVTTGDGNIDVKQLMSKIEQLQSELQMKSATLAQTNFDKNRELDVMINAVNKLKAGVSEDEMNMIKDKEDRRRYNG